MESVPLHWEQSFNHWVTREVFAHGSLGAVGPKVLDSKGGRDAGVMGVSPDDDTGKLRWADQEKRGARVSGAGHEPWFLHGSCQASSAPSLSSQVDPTPCLTLLPPPDSSDDSYYLDDYSQVRCHVLWEALPLPGFGGPVSGPLPVPSGQ